MERYQEALGTQEAKQRGQSAQARAIESAQEARERLGLAKKLWSKAGLGADLAGGLLSAVCAAGMRAVYEVFEEEVTERVGNKGKHNGERDAVRHGYDTGEVTFGGRRISIRRPRMRYLSGGEIPLATYQWATGREILNQMAYQRVLAGVSTRNYPLTLEPVSARDAHRPKSISKSAISRRFVALTRKALDLLVARDLSQLRVVALMIDGIYVAGRVLIVVMAIDVDGFKHVVSVREGTTENKEIAKDVLVDLVDRKLNYSAGLLVVMDGSKALAAAVRTTFGDKAFIQRCIEHKVRNVTSYLPKDQQGWVVRAMRRAWSRNDPDLAMQDLLALVKRLEETNISAAKSLRDGLEQTVTIQRLGVGQLLARTLRTTNPIESMNEIIRTKTRLVKHWKGGDMRERWVAAAMLEAESQFRRVQGHKELADLAATLYSVTVLKQPLTGGAHQENAA